MQMAEVPVHLPLSLKSAAAAAALVRGLAVIPVLHCHGPCHEFGRKHTESLLSARLPGGWKCTRKFKTLHGAW